MQAKKFYATLPAKLDRAEEEWHRSQPTTPQPEIIEHPPDGSRAQDLLGGEMQIKAPWVQDDDV